MAVYGRPPTSRLYNKDGVEMCTGQAGEAGRCNQRYGHVGACFFHMNPYHLPLHREVAKQKETKMSTKIKNNTTYTLAMIILLAVLALLLTGCSSASQDPNVEDTWTYSEDGVSFEASVKDGTILMSVDFDGSSGLYWAGDFPTDIEPGTTVTSNGDTEALSKSLYGSMSETKDFTYEDGELRFDFTMMGVTKEVGLSR